MGPRGPLPDAHHGDREMTFLDPLALVAGLLAIPILVLYMLKLRRREVQVSSTFLWQILLRDRQANTPWQRLKRNLLLFLQLLILAALVLALARPALNIPSIAGGSLVVLLDGSASMNARLQPDQNTSLQNPGGMEGLQGRDSPTRFEAARAAVQNLIAHLPDGSRMTLILVSSQPHALISAENDKSELERALNAAQASQSIADWQAAFALAAGAASSLNGSNGQSGKENQIVIVSDGGLPKSGLPALPGEVRYLPIGKDSDNLAVSALALRPSPSGLELFAQATNYGDREQQAILSIYSDGKLLKAQQIDVPAGGQKNLVLDGLQEQKSVFEAQLSPPGKTQAGGSAADNQDIFPLDDRAYAVYNPMLNARTLLVSQKNIFLDQLLSSLPGIQPYRALPDEENRLKLPGESFDVYVLDGFYPQDASADSIVHSNLMLINPPENDLFEVSGTFTTTGNSQVNDSPLTEFVDWRNVHVAKARRIQTPGWANVLVDTPAGPLVFVGETGGRRVAVISFDLHDSDLPVQVAYPILFANLFQYLTQSQSIQITIPAAGLHPGDSVLLQPRQDIENIRIQDPSGRQFPLQVRESGALFSDTSESGIYTVTSSGAGGSTGNDNVSRDAFAVNLFSPLESDLHSVEAIQVGSSPVAAAKQAELGQREYWSWLAALALTLLLGEWWLYHRRQVIPTSWQEWALRFRTKGQNGAKTG